jgi:hypothetical protein
MNEVTDTTGRHLWHRGLCSECGKIPRTPGKKTCDGCRRQRRGHYRERVGPKRPSKQAEQSPNPLDALIGHSCARCGSFVYGESVPTGWVQFGDKLYCGNECYKLDHNLILGRE